MNKVILRIACHRFMHYTSNEVCGCPALTPRDDGSMCKESAPPSGGVRLSRACNNIAGDLLYFRTGCLQSFAAGPMRTCSPFGFAATLAAVAVMAFLIVVWFCRNCIRICLIRLAGRCNRPKITLDAFLGIPNTQLNVVLATKTRARVNPIPL